MKDTPMTLSRFCRYELRTTDVDAASSFYDAVLGGRGDGIVALPEAARARGAPAHWLGHVGVDDVGAVTARFEARGATRLGPPGAPVAILRAAGGEIFALCRAGATSHAGVVWHLLHTDGALRSATDYGDVLGWSIDAPIDRGPLGTMRDVAWSAGEPAAGAMVDVVGRTGVHTHWLFFFGVSSLDAAVEAVRARGGKVIGPMVAADGARIAVCDDPQGAAFGLLQSRA